MKKILIVEDEKFIATVYQEIFQRAGFKVLTKSSADTALTLSKAEKPKVILLDLVFPDKSAKNGQSIRLNKEVGYGLLKELQKDPETKDIPVLIISNLSSDAEKVRAESAGAKDFIVKSNFLPEEIVDKVNQWAK